MQPIAPGPQASVPAPPSPARKERVVAGVLALLLGGLGVHKFYLGYVAEGLVMIGVYVALVGAAFVLAFGSFFIGGACGSCVLPFASAWGVVPLIEGILYLTKSDEEFQRTYVVGRRGWF